MLQAVLSSACQLTAMRRTTLTNLNSRKKDRMSRPMIEECRVSGPKATKNICCTDTNQSRTGAMPTALRRGASPNPLFVFCGSNM